MHKGYPPRGFSATGSCRPTSFLNTVPRCLFRSADDVSMQDEPHTLRINQSSLLIPPAVVKHEAELIANACRRAAKGSLAPYTITILANTADTVKSKSCHLDSQIHATRAREGTSRRFSAVPRGYGPLRLPTRSHYTSSLTLTPSSCLITLPNMTVLARTLGLYIPDSIKEELLSGTLASVIARPRASRQLPDCSAVHPYPLLL